MKNILILSARETRCFSKAGRGLLQKLPKIWTGKNSYNFLEMDNDLVYITGNIELFDFRSLPQNTISQR